MSDIVFDKVNSIPYTKGRKVKQKTFLKNFFLSTILLILFLLLAIVGFYYFIFIPNTSVANFQFYGNTVLSEVFLKDIAHIKMDTKWNKIDTLQIAQSIASISMVETVTVEKKFPDQIIINIKERIPVAMTFAEIDSISSPVLIDKNGVLFRNSEIDIQSYPIISGLNFENFSDGLRLNTQLIQLLNNILELQTHNPHLLNQISEIKIIPKQYGGYELVLFPISKNIRVRVLDKLDVDTLKYTILVLDVITEIDDSHLIDEIDLRSGIAIVRKEHNNE